MDLQILKNEYAQEQGYEDWNEIRKEFREKAVTFTEMTSHENEVIIRAQKAALEKAAKNGMIEILVPSSSVPKSVKQYENSDGVVRVSRASITNAKNLIQ